MQATQSQILLLGRIFSSIVMFEQEYILRSSYLFPVTFLCVHRHFSLRPVVTDRRTDDEEEEEEESERRTGLTGRTGSAIENAGRFCR
jgi:hypothetical protein